MNSGIEGKLIAHDLHQFEMKLGYTLDQSAPINKYNIELYFFIPKSLNINHHTYSKDNFFGDIQGYLRFKTPMFTFQEIADVHNQRSPLTRIHRILDTNTGKEKLVSELKLYACIFRVAVRSSITQLRRKIGKKDVVDLEEMVSELCNGITNCLAQIRALQPRFSQPNVDDETAKVFRQVDEYLGIVTEELLNSLSNTILDSQLAPSFTEELSEKVAKILHKEYNYRRDNKYAVQEKEGENELFLYRKGLLKKLVNSILFLETHTQEGVTYVRDLVFAIAAGVSMMIAAGVTVWAGRRWSATSIPFILAIVIGYMVKDRIKDWLKFIFSKRMTRWLSDYKTDIIDVEAGSKIGVCRQAFSFISEKSVPLDVLTLRRSPAQVGTFWLPEEVIKYEKEVTLKTNSIIRFHTRLGDVTDIIRFNIHKFLERMDEPYEIHKAYNFKTEEMEDIKCARVYHVNLILKLGDKTRKIRLILNRDGIKRIEEIRPASN